MDDEKFYQAVADELRSNRINDALWTKAIAKSMGDEHKTKAVYIQLRVDQLMEEERRTQAKEKLQEEVETESETEHRRKEAENSVKELGMLALKAVAFVVGLYLIYKYLFPLGQALRSRFFD